LITTFGAAFAGGVVWSTAGMVAMGSSFASGSSHASLKPQLFAAGIVPARLLEKPATTGKVQRLRAAPAKPVVAPAQPAIAASLAPGGGKAAPRADIAERAAANLTALRFDAVVKKAGLTSGKLASLFDRSPPAKSHRPAAKLAAPAPERFAPLPATPADQPPTLLAYADPSPASAAMSALLAKPSEEGLAASQNPDLEIDEDLASLPDYEDTPDGGPLPQLRPGSGEARKPAAEAIEPDDDQIDRPVTPKAVEPKKADEREAPKTEKRVAARPSNPAKERSSGGSFGQSFRNLFGGGARAGNRVAVYDISAARVYMPDGSVLEAHSGIGKMADNPRYVHVRMNGPTPPHTYNLKMREKRFHGVEAIRMLPVDGRNKHGRDGFLTHSYLLRGGRAESHGCVAFKDYKRFLNAFKQGKVTQLVVVPSGGRAGVRVASNGKRI
jgi:Protein of unknown function (DUF2778)